MIRTAYSFAATVFAIVLSMGSGQAQEAWSLERCVRHAQETNLSIQQANLGVKSASLNEKQARLGRMPALNGSFNLNEQFGRTIDPFTNTFNNVAITSNSINLTAAATLFSGGQIEQSIKQAGWDVLASRADAEQIGSNLALQVAQAYLTILLTEEQIKNAKNRVEQSKNQLANTDKLIEVGTLPAADRLNLLAQIARDEQAQVTVENNRELALLNLKQLLQLEPDYNLQIERPEVSIPSDANPEGFILKSVFGNALASQATIRAADFRIKSAETGVKIARAGYFPTVSLFANLNTVYSSQAQNVKFGDPELGDPVEVVINGQPIQVQFYGEPRIVTKPNYFSQLNENFGQSVGLSVDIPIYQRGRTDIGVQRAKLGIQDAQIRSNQVRQQLKTDIQTSIANARSAKKQLEAAQKTYEAMKMAYENMQKRHTLGAVNALELTTAKTNFDVSENDLLVARYDYLFKLKIIDFYNGKRLSLN